MNRHLGGFNSKTPVAELHGHIFGYNQIKLAETDQEKTLFVTNQGLFCYKVMPFRVQNARAIYQRLMNKMFTHQIERNVQVYVNDMLVKNI